MPTKTNMMYCNKVPMRTVITIQQQHTQQKPKNERSSFQKMIEVEGGKNVVNDKMFFRCVYWCEILNSVCRRYIVVFVCVGWMRQSI